MRGPAKGAYKSCRGGGELQKSVVGLVDLLGFSRAVIEATADGTAADLLRKVSLFIGTWRKALKPYNRGLEGHLAWEVRIFTDNILISHPIRMHELEGDLEMGDLLNQVSLLQLGAILDGFFVRGAMAVGDMLINRDIIFGVPLVHAHHTESCVANTPRILLTDSAKEFVLRRVGQEPSQGSPYVRELLWDRDGRLFINYLDACFQTSGDPPILDWVSKHRDATVEALERFGSHPKIGPKYHWVAAYHNFWCQSRGIPDRIIEGSGFLSARPLNA